MNTNKMFSPLVGRYRGGRNFKVKKRAKVRKEEWRRIRTNLRRVLIFFILLGIILLFFLLQAECKKFLFSSPVFKIREIEIRGISEEKANALIKKTNLEEGKNIFRFNLKEVSARLSRELPIRKVVILRHLPDKIIIEVEKRIPLAIVKWNSQIFGIDMDGVVLYQPPNFSILPEVKGILEQRPLPGVKVKDNDLKIVMEILDLFAKTLPDFRIQAIDLSQKRRIILSFDENSCLYLSSENLTNNFSRLKRVLADLSQKDIKYKYIDLRFKDIYVQPVEKKKKNER